MIIDQKVLNEVITRSSGNIDPFYIYDAQEVKRNCNSFLNLDYQNKSIHFATMANTNQLFLALVRSAGINVFVNSIIHFRIALSSGFEPSQVIFTSSGLSKEILSQVGRKGVQLNLDSPMQLANWNLIFHGEKVGIRCNIGDHVRPYSNHAGSFIGKESRLGFTIDEIRAIKDKSQIRGLHLYAGTDIFDIDYLMACYNEIVEISRSFDNLEYLNFGGGFGVSEDDDRKFDFNLYNSGLNDIMRKANEIAGKELMLYLEPGRIIGGEAGYFVCHVTDIKSRPDQLLVGVNASTVQFSRPLLYPDTAMHPVAILRDGAIVGEASSNLPTTIFGNSTYSRDIFANRRSLPQILPGDKLIFGNAGSYSASSYTMFLGFEKPFEFFV